MMYSNNFVICILIEGKPAKELANGTVPIPFGTEYAIRLRNKNSRRAVATISVDGENVSGGGYVVDGKSYIDIKRHYDKDVAFKFVDLDSPDAVDFGKNGPNIDKVKGTIKVEFKLEKERPKPSEVHHYHHYNNYWDWPYKTWPKTWPKPYYRYGSNLTRGSSAGSIGSGLSGSSLSGNVCGGFGGIVDENSVEITNSAMPASADFTCLSVDGVAQASIGADAQNLKDGCTVEGEATGQYFYSVYVDLEDTSTVLSVFLQGFTQPLVTARPKHSGGKISDLEAENQRLREELARLENAELKRQLSEKKPKKRRTKKAKA